MGEWIPEPLHGSTEWITGPSGSATLDPADRVTVDDTLTRRLHASAR